jgi:hypothetical protein
MMDIYKRGRKKGGGTERERGRKRERERDETRAVRCNPY